MSKPGSKGKVLVLVLKKGGGGSEGEKGSRGGKDSILGTKGMEVAELMLKLKKESSCGCCG